MSTKDTKTANPFDLSAPAEALVIKDYTDLNLKISLTGKSATEHIQLLIEALEDEGLVPVVVNGEIVIPGWKESLIDATKRNLERLGYAVDIKSRVRSGCKVTAPDGSIKTTILI